MERVEGGLELETGRPGPRPTRDERRGSRKLEGRKWLECDALERKKKSLASR